MATLLRASFAPGDHVAVWASNSPEWVILELGCALAGIVLVTANPAYQAEELRYVLQQSGAKGVIYQESFRGRDLGKLVTSIEDQLPNLETTFLISHLFAELEHTTPSTEVNLDPASIAQIQYTSGTTGFPKGACLHHLGLSNNSRLYAQTIGATDADVWINAMPMFHTAGCGLATLGALQTGGRHVLAPEFDAGLMLDLFETEQGTIMLCVPTMLVRMLEEQRLKPRDLSTWRIVSLGGAPVAPELIRRAEEELGLTVVIGFGQTEASPYITHTLVDDPHPHWQQTVGKPLPHTDIKIIHPVDGATLPVGETGEICARGYNIMRGYHDNPEASAQAVDDAGWLHTGDLGHLDQHGYCYVHGRLKDMIIRGGENIYPREIEDVLFTHPAISNAVVLGLPNDEWGEIVVACVVPSEGTHTDADSLMDYCRQHLASYKVPREWHFYDNLPQTASGKVQKFVLQEQLMKV